MVKWLVATDDGKTHDLVYREGEYQPFTLYLNGHIFPKNFTNVQEIRQAMKDFGKTVTEFLQVEGSMQFPIDPHK